MEGWVIAKTETPSEEEKKKNKHKGLLRFSFVGVGASVVVMIAAIICKGVPKLKRVELQTACKDFSNIIGSSLDGTIYKGILSSGVEIVVASTAVLSAHDWSTQLEENFRKKVLLRMLLKYHDHVHTYENTLITMFFGLHRIKPSTSQKFFFVVMGNMFCTELRIHKRFDIKGSSLGRSADKVEIDENTILKDLDLKDCFCLEPSWQTDLLNTSTDGLGALAEEDDQQRKNNGGELLVLSGPTGKDIGISFELSQELGRGEFGITYLCTDKSIGNTFSCKSILKKKLRTAVDIEDVRREVEIMKHLPPHLNIVRLKDMYEDDVASCHIHGLIHRNLKAENFLFANKKEIAPLKAIDFGLSVFFKPAFAKTYLSIAPQVVAKNFCVEEVVGIKESFQLMDVNNNGKITLGELKVGLGKVGHNVPDVDLQMLMEAANVDGNGTLNFGEYVVVTIHLRKIGNDEYLHKAFTFFNKIKNGYIEIEELRDALADEVDTNNEEVITAIIHDVDTKKVSHSHRGGSLKVGPEKEGKSEEDVSQDVSEEGSDDDSEEEEEYEMKKMRSYPDEIPDIFMLDSSHGRAGHSRNA
ncbi:hypothetical protein GIB67_003803 [Kingdonia uniflora]|uniref:Calcium-dependent protein kinase n=1 Tax=Kingdonia uniflora TaxID=39325 RepID=A0A7J7P3H9_9MAGN|nr:hypothetical protein GIB67_003803 [Kingdonia uniflora]